MEHLSLRQYSHLLCEWQTKKVVELLIECGNIQAEGVRKDAAPIYKCGVGLACAQLRKEFSEENVQALPKIRNLAQEADC